MSESSLHTVFKALGHPKRLRIVERLIQRAHNCCEVNKVQNCCLEEPTCNFGDLADELQIPKSSLSLHLKELRHAGLVDQIKHGRMVSLHINPQRLNEIKDFFEITLDDQTFQMIEGQ